MNIGKASKLSELTVKTVRYYANIDLVKPKQSSLTGYREYSEEDVLKLKFIGKARKFNFSINECRELLSLYENQNRPSKEVKKITLEKVSEIDKKLNELKNLRDELNYLANNYTKPSRSASFQAKKMHTWANSIVFMHWE